MKSILNDANPKDWDILCLQELPYFIDVHLSYRSPYWHLFLPTPTSKKSKHDLIRSVVYVNKSLPSDSCTQIPIESLDITAISFSFPNFSFSLFSIYNPPQLNSSIVLLTRFFKQNAAQAPIILMGDFNSHHPLWAGPHVPRRTQRSKSEPLIELLAELDLTLCLPPGTPTYLSDSHKRWSTLDLVFATTDITEQVNKCTTSSGHGSDHRAIEVTLDIDAPRAVTRERFQWRNVDWDAFNKELEHQLLMGNLDDRCASLVTAEDIDAAVETLNVDLVATAEKVVPRSKPSPFTKRW